MTDHRLDELAQAAFEAFWGEWLKNTAPWSEQKEQYKENWRNVAKAACKCWFGNDAWNSIDPVLRNAWMQVATAAISAMGGEKRFGVYNQREKRWLKLGTDAFFTHDENAAKAVKWLADSHWPHALHQVREYTPPAAEIPKEAIAEFKKAFDFYACDGHDRAVEMGLTAAIPHLKGGE